MSPLERAFTNPYAPDTHPAAPWILSATAGLLLIMAWPPVNLPMLQFAAFVILFRLLREAPTTRTALLTLLPGLWIWNLGTTYWLMMATFAGGSAAILANGILMLIPLALIRHLLNTRSPSWIAALLAGALWASYEFLHHNWDLAWPWLTLGNGWANLPMLIQHISWTGYLILSVWVIAGSILLEQTLRTRSRAHLRAAMLVLIASPLLSAWAAWQWEPDEGTAMEVAVIQPNHDSYQAHGGYSSTDEVIEKLLELTAQTRTHLTELIVWPENAIDRSMPARNAWTPQLTDSLQSWGSRLITGAGYIEYYEREEERPPIYRTTSQGTTYNVFNSAFYLTPGHETPDIYKKGRLVPLVERFPFAETLHRLDIRGWIPWQQIIGYGKGEEANRFPVGYAETPALICYDSVFPSWVNQFTDDHPGFLTIITNDGWWGDTSGHSQHFAYARLRAIEQRQWVVRSANNGISGIIAPDGSVHRKTEYWERTGFVHDIHASLKPTLYSRIGDRFNYVLLLLSALSLLLILREKGRKGDEAGSAR